MKWNFIFIHEEFFHIKFPSFCIEFFWWSQLFVWINHAIYIFWRADSQETEMRWVYWGSKYRRIFPKKIQTQDEPRHPRRRLAALGDDGTSLCHFRCLSTEPFLASWSVARARNSVVWGLQYLLDACCFCGVWTECNLLLSSISERERKPETSSRCPAWTEWSLWARWRSLWCDLASSFLGRCGGRVCRNDLRFRAE